MDAFAVVIILYNTEGDKFKGFSIKKHYLYSFNASQNWKKLKKKKMQANILFCGMDRPFIFYILTASVVGFSE